jgi:RNA polymerase sigma-70 factor (ECF subfamily)
MLGSVTDRDLENLGDAGLAVAIARWRKDALSEAYRRHAGAVFALARRVLVDASLAEEVVQEVFLDLWYRPERFDPDRGSLRSFLLAQTHGKAVDLVRSEQSRRNREEREARLRVDPGQDIDQEVWQLTVAERVRKALEALRPEERRAIELAYFGGRTYREAAAVLGEPEGTVKTRIRAGLRRMREQLAELGIGSKWESS